MVVVVVVAVVVFVLFTYLLNKFVVKLDGKNISSVLLTTALLMMNSPRPLPYSSAPILICTLKLFVAICHAHVSLIISNDRLEHCKVWIFGKILSTTWARLPLLLVGLPLP